MCPAFVERASKGNHSFCLFSLLASEVLVPINWSSKFGCGVGGRSLKFGSLVISPFILSSASVLALPEDRSKARASFQLSFVPSTLLTENPDLLHRLPPFAAAWLSSGEIT